MKKIVLSNIAALALCVGSLNVYAAPGPRTYQVTGPITELTDSKIVVQKGDEKWEIARTPDTKVDGSLKVGAKVTIHYTMSAKNVEVKAK